MVDHRADRECDLVLAAQRPSGAPDATLNVQQIPLGGIEQLASFARALIGEQRVAADDKALFGIAGPR